jgi:hypothetical protein
MFEQMLISVPVFATEKTSEAEAEPPLAANLQPNAIKMGSASDQTIVASRRDAYASALRNIARHFTFWFRLWR